jgi:hypothetical protein
MVTKALLVKDGCQDQVVQELPFVVKDFDSQQYNRTLEMISVSDDFRKFMQGAGSEIPDKPTLSKQQVLKHFETLQHYTEMDEKDTTDLFGPAYSENELAINSLCKRERLHDMLYFKTGIETKVFEANVNCFIQKVKDEQVKQAYNEFAAKQKA